MSNENIIECKDLNKYYSGVHALKNLSLKIKRDSVVGLIGDNGAGKSTLIKILSGAHAPDTGHIYFEGNEVKFKSTKQAMNLGIETIYQYSALIPQMSIARNIFIGREQTNFSLGSIGLMKSKTMDKAAMDALNDVELHLRSPDTPVNQLSGGERQGVVIARAMYFKSKVLILDEPTSGLDPNQLEEIRALIKELGKNKTVILSTHIMQEVESICDRIVVIKNGSIVADKYLEQNSNTLNNIKEQIVSVEFENEISITKLKKGLPKIKIEKKENKFLFYYNGNEDLRKLISSFAQKDELLILEIKKHSDKLEDLFKKLTK